MGEFGLSEAQLKAAPISFRPDLFAGRVVLVSGGGSGIGKATAMLFGRLGAAVAICGRQPGKLDGTLALLREVGAEAAAFPMSIRDPEAVAKLHADVAARFGRLDVLVNNAGGQFPQAAIDFSPKGFSAVVDTNLNGTWYMMQAAARGWRDCGERGGAIVNIVAVVGRGMPGIAHTCAARAGVIGLTKTVAVEWAPLGIRVNCVAPGVVATEGMAVYPEEARRAMPNSNPMKRSGSAWEIAEAVAYLAGPGAAFATGEVLTIDGGGQMWGDLWAIPRPAYFDVGASG